MFFNFGKKNSKPNFLVTEKEKPKNSPTFSTSPKARNRTSSLKHVQSFAGPLLASTRFNTSADSSVHINTHSPGFTSRLVRASNKGSSSSLDSSRENYITHQSKYGRVGLFPRVQLGGSSPLPTLSFRNSTKVSKTPVRVRIAPPSTNIHRLQRRHSMSGVDSVQPKAIDSVDSSNKGKGDSNSETPQEVSRKRIFSDSVDVTDVPAEKKRQRKGEAPIPNPNSATYQYRHIRSASVTAPTPVAVAVSTPPLPVCSTASESQPVPQSKRARDKSSPEEEKRQRRKVCSANNEILSSLSSSQNLLKRLAVQKRKSHNISELSTPVLGKQIKQGSPSDIHITKSKSKSPKEQRSSTSPTNGYGETPALKKKNEKIKIPQPARLSKSDAISGVSSGIKKPAVSPSNESTTKKAVSVDNDIKLFRKDVSCVHSRNPAINERKKNNFWIQPPEMDEFLVTKNNDGSTLDRPERFKSLYKRMVGKTSSQEASNSDSKNVSDVAKSAISPTSKIKKAPKKVTFNLPNETSQNIQVSASFPPVTSPNKYSSSALTVTVSSTNTVMTTFSITSAIADEVKSDKMSSVSAPITVGLASNKDISTGQLNFGAKPIVSALSSCETPKTIASTPAVSTPVPTAAPTFQFSPSQQLSATVQTPPFSVSQTSQPAPTATVTSICQPISSAQIAAGTKTFTFGMTPGQSPQPTVSLQPVSFGSSPAPSNPVPTTTNSTTTSQPVGGFSFGGAPKESFPASATFPSQPLSSGQPATTSSGFKFGDLPTKSPFGNGSTTFQVTSPQQPVTTTPSVAAPLTFGSTPASQSQPPIKPQAFNFSSMAAPNFGTAPQQPVTTAPSVATPLTFGSTPSSQSQPSTKPQTFTFGSNSATAPNFVTSPQQPVTAAPSVATPLTFGSTPSLQSQPPTKPHTFAFGSTGAPSQNLFNSNPSTLSFGGTSSIKPTPAQPSNSATFTFGSSKPPSENKNNLGNADITKSSPFLFNTQSASTNSSNIFKSPAAASATNSVFAGSSTAPSSTSSTFQFGSNSTIPTQPPASSNSAGSNSSSQNTGAFQFNPTPSFSFGSTNAFGASGLNTTLPSSSSSAFRAAAFFSSATTNSGSSPAFGAAVTTSTSNSNPSFGQPSFGQTTPAFGAAPAAAPSFGAPNSFQFGSNNSGGAATSSAFGGPSASFAFGSSAPASSASSSFQFGGPSNSFPPPGNSSGTELFSIGAGSTGAQTPRRIREARRRR